MEKVEDLIIYLNILKSQNLIHKKTFGKEKNIEIPSLLSEFIVREELKLCKYNSGICQVTGKKDKKFDAQDKENTPTMYYEIKATSSKEGTTTINIQGKPNCLIWAYFNFEDDTIIIKMFLITEKLKTLGDYIVDEKIASIRRKRVKNKTHEKNELFSDVYSSEKDKRISINLDFLKWNEKETKKFSMKTLELIA